MKKLLERFDDLALTVHFKLYYSRVWWILWFPWAVFVLPYFLIRDYVG